MELAQNPNQNDIWSCKASNAVWQACERGMDFEHPALNTLGGRESAGPYRLQPQL